MTSEERRRRRFTAKFRKEQVELIESGKLSVQDVSGLYEVKPQNVRRWLKKYGKKEVPGLILIGHSSEVNRIKDVERELKKLKLLYADAQIELSALHYAVELAKGKLGDDYIKKADSRY